MKWAKKEVADGVPFFCCVFFSVLDHIGVQISDGRTLGSRAIGFEFVKRRRSAAEQPPGQDSSQGQ